MFRRDEIEEEEKKLRRMLTRQGQVKIGLGHQFRTAEEGNHANWFQTNRSKLETLKSP